MKTLMLAACVSVTFAAFNVMADAQAAGAPRSLHDELTRTQGMTEVSEGLYQSTKDDTDTFVAVGSAGNKALLEKLIDMRAAGSDAPFAPNDERSSNYVIDSLIGVLGTPGGANDIEDGDCNGINVNGPFHLEAHAGGIIGPQYGASALVHNPNAAINTTNVAKASLTNRLGNPQGSQTTTTFGTTDAVASKYVTVGAGCIANSSATITCPGASSPAVTAVAFNHNPSCIIP